MSVVALPSERRAELFFAGRKPNKTGKSPSPAAIDAFSLPGHLALAGLAYRRRRLKEQKNVPRPGPIRMRRHDVREYA